MKVSDGYDRRKKPAQIEVRPMTVDEAKRLTYGQQVEFIAADGTLRCLKVNGAPKVWKRDAGRCEVPVKYGLYECGRLSALPDGTMEQLVVRI